MERDAQGNIVRFVPTLTARDQSCSFLHANLTRSTQVPDPERFPDGINGLADYVHSKGLKLGLCMSFLRLFTQVYA
jgi:hypothetical protein